VAKQPETKFKEKVQKDLSNLEECWFVKICQTSVRGIPDFLICYKGFFVALELKMDIKKARNRLQDWTLQCISDCGGISFIATPNNWKNTLEAIESIGEELEEIEEILYEQEGDEIYCFGNKTKH